MSIYHEQDFGLSSAWHYLTKSHEKGPAARTGKAMKRLAAKTSLQQVYIKCFMNYSITVAATNNITFFYGQEE
jgi:hypothetical protein